MTKERKVAEEAENKQSIFEENDDLDELDQALPLHLVRGTRTPTPDGTWRKLWEMQQN